MSEENDERLRSLPLAPGYYIDREGRVLRKMLHEQRHSWLTPISLKSAQDECEKSSSHRVGTSPDKFRPRYASMPLLLTTEEEAIIQDDESGERSVRRFDAVEVVIFPPLKHDLQEEAYLVGFVLPLVGEVAVGWYLIRNERGSVLFHGESMSADLFAQRA